MALSFCLMLVAIYLLFFFLWILFFYYKFLSMELEQKADKNRTEWMLEILLGIYAVLSSQYFIYISGLLVCGLAWTVRWHPDIIIISLLALVSFLKEPKGVITLVIFLGLAYYPTKIGN